jgi:hypothetical protein
MTRSKTGAFTSLGSRSGFITFWNYPRKSCLDSKRAERILEESPGLAVYQQQRDCLFLPCPGFLMDEVDFQVLDIGGEMVSFGDLLLCFWP